MQIQSKQVTAFVKQFTPFALLPESLVEAIIQYFGLIHLEKGQFLFKKEEPYQSFVYLINNGAIKLTKSGGETSAVIELCDKGDFVGLDPLFKNASYNYYAVAHEDTFLFKIPIHELKQLMLENEVFAKVLSQIFYELIDGKKLKGKEKPVSKALNNEDGGSLINSDFTTVQAVAPVYTIFEESSVHEAALTMAEKKIGSLLISNDKNFPIGIITEADINRKVVAMNRLPSSIKVGEIMSSPVVTVPDKPNVSDLLILSAKKSIRHFCVTKDGTDQSEITGIISERDILAAQGSNPTVLIKKILHCNSVVALKAIRDTTDVLLHTYLEQEIALHFVLDIITHINDAITEKCIELAISRLKKEGYGEPPVDFCWLSLGSEGRKEQLLRTDQDNAIIYADSENDEPTNSKYFIRLGEEVTEMLYEIGFEKCPFEIMASNKNYCRPLYGWKELFKKWIFASDSNAILHAHIFFDLRPVFGNKRLAIDLQQYIFHLISQEKRFISLLAHNATLNPVPLSFFRRFMVEKKGEFSNLFDSKARALMPISDAARVMAYDAKIPVFGSTIERLKRLSAQDENNKELFDEIIMAFEILIRLRAKNGLKHKDDGRFVEIDTLNKLQRQTLKHIFSLTEKLQEVIKIRFQTDYIR